MEAAILELERKKKLQEAGLKYILAKSDRSRMPQSKASEYDYVIYEQGGKRG